MAANDYIDDMYRDEDEDYLDTLIPVSPLALYSQEPLLKPVKTTLNDPSIFMDSSEPIRYLGL